MSQSPGLYLAALFLWFVPLFTLRSELDFLKTPGLPRSQRILFWLSFLGFILLDLTFLLHTRFPNVLVFTATLVTILLAMVVLALLLLRGRLAIFRELSRARREERRVMIQEVGYLIDEQKRAKIRAKYGETEPQ
ncbi:MAG TPA: hypothetical protein VEI97_09710 [bacterium]|nr:hypothetical protein [bacterium]